ncbi:MAG: PAS domain S-box protein, partial [Thermoleophilia bacterium]|nr:PAS domain S-box protein [Thermoleophilia bacterium]
MMEKESTREELLSEIEELRPRLAEAEEIIGKIQKGEVDALVVSGEDAPELYLIQGAERPYRILVESMNEGAISLTAEGVILYANKSFVDMTDAPSSSKLVGTYFRDLVADEDNDSFGRLWKNILEEAFITDLQLSVAGAKIPVHMSFSPSMLDDQPTVFAVITDISERKQAEENRNSLLDQLS